MMEKQPNVELRSVEAVPRKTFTTHQLHVWITDRDYEFLSNVAAEYEQTLAQTVRQLIRAVRKQHTDLLGRRGLSA